MLDSGRWAKYISLHREQYNVEVGQHVIVETARGIEYGHVVLGEREVEDSAVVQPLKAIIRNIDT